MIFGVSSDAQRLDPRLDGGMERELTVVPMPSFVRATSAGL